MEIQKWFLRKTSHGYSGVVHAARFYDGVFFLLCTGNQSFLLPVKDTSNYRECPVCLGIIAKLVSDRITGQGLGSMVDWETKQMVEFANRRVASNIDIEAFGKFKEIVYGK